MRTQLIIAALVGSNLAVGSVLIVVARRAAAAQRAMNDMAIKLAQQRPADASPGSDVIFLEGSGLSLVQREAMRASAIAARNRANARVGSAGTTQAIVAEPTLQNDPKPLANPYDLAASAAHTKPVVAAPPPTQAAQTVPASPSPATPATAQGSNTKLVELLVAFENAGGASGRPASLDEQLALTAQAAALPALERAAIADTLRSAAAEGTFPALFLLARLHEAAGEPSEAARWYLTANIVRIIDSKRFKQDPGGATSQKITSMFSNVQEQLRGNAELRRSAVAFALDLEDAIAERPPASWLTDKPMLSADQLAGLCVSDAAWRASRDAVRASLRSALTPADPSAAQASEPQASAWRVQMWGVETLPAQATQPAHTNQPALATQPEEPF